VYAGLPSGGILVVIENVIDDARRTHTFGLHAGFARTDVRHLAGPTSAVIAYEDQPSRTGEGADF
jgi:hypothetical protein